MKLFLLFSVIIINSFNICSQFRYHFETFPTDAEVIMNDSIICKTPCNVDFYWHDAIDDKIIFSIEKDGFYSWSDTINEKPRRFDFYFNENL